MFLEKNAFNYDTDIVNECINKIPFEKLVWKGEILDTHDICDLSGVAKKNNITIPNVLKKIISDVGNKYPETKELGIWVNHYRNENDYIPWHKDSLTKNKNIYILSLGSSRPFLISNNETGDIHGYILEHGDMLIMSHNDNEKNKHMVPKMGYSVDSRISIVFS